MNTVYSWIDAYGMMAGRILMGLLFVFSGASIVLMGIDATVGAIESVGLPMAMLGAWVAVIVKIAAGGALMLGYRQAEAALVLIAFTVLVTLLFHLNLEDINLLKNLAIIGGLLCFVAHTRVGGGRSQQTMVM